MRKDKEIAIQLRSAGRSYNEIVAALKIPKSTLSEWFSRENWSVEIRKKLTDAAQLVSVVRMKELDRIRGTHLARIYEEARVEAREEFEQLKYNPLFIAGVMLYWGEGDKVTKHQVRLTNSDAEMSRLFVHFIKKICQVPSAKIRANVLIYPDLDPVACIDHWSEKTTLDKRSFTKCVTIQGRHKTKRLSHGVCIVIVSSTYLKVKVLEWLKLLPGELMSKGYYVNI